MQITHKRFNHLLTICIALFALYILVAPFIRDLSWITKDKSNGAPYAGALRSGTIKTGEVKPTPTDNRIVIPSALIDLPIKEGTSLSVVDNGGAWRKNINTSNPKEIGNTVIIAHRFFYQMPDDGFYHLDRVQVGDRLAVYWEGQELLYEVKERKTVPQTAIEVENNTTKRILTLYTCTPVITAENRLVLVAEPVEAL